MTNEMNNEEFQNWINEVGFSESLDEDFLLENKRLEYRIEYQRFEEKINEHTFENANRGSLEKEIETINIKLEELEVFLNETREPGDHRKFMQRYTMYSQFCIKKEHFFLKEENTKILQEARNVKKDLFSIMGLFLTIFTFIQVNFSFLKGLEQSSLMARLGFAATINLILLLVLSLIFYKIEVIINGELKRYKKTIWVSIAGIVLLLVFIFSTYYYEVKNYRWRLIEKVALHKK